MTRSVFRKSNGYPDRRLMHPRREWGIGLFIFSVVMISGSLVAANLFVTYKNIESADGDPGNSIPRYQERDTSDALDLYRQRTKNYAALRGSQPVEVTAVEGAASSSASSTVEVE